MAKEKTYTISEVAEKMHVAPSTLRYYDAEGLLPFVDRVNGRRVFKESDFGGLRLIECLKSTGMPIRDIKEYFQLAKRGDETLVERQAIILKQKQAILDQIEFMKRNLKEIEYKEWYYKTAIEAGMESIHDNSCGLQDDE